jgi:hypothetical protein
VILLEYNFYEMRLQSFVWKLRSCHRVILREYYFLHDLNLFTARYLTKGVKARLRRSLLSISILFVDDC